MSIIVSNSTSEARATLGARADRTADSASVRAPERIEAEGLRLWGLSALQLHDAFWKSRGVQCVRMGRPAPIERADLYLLLRPQQLVLFDLDALLNRLIWQRACITTLRIVDDSCGYHESAITDDQGNIQRIERRYDARTTPHGRVHVTDRPGLAARWLTVTSNRAWRRTMRQDFPEPLIARANCSGRCFAADQPHHVARLLSELVDCWPDPERVLEGLEVLADGVRIQRGQGKPDSTVIGPAWIGCGAGLGHEPACIVGPTWLPDRQSASSGSRTVRVRRLSEIESPEPVASARPRRSSERPRMYPVAKRVFDVLVSATALLASLPILVLVAFAVFLDDGFPLLFRHRRQSRHGKPFDCLKFRTMYSNAEHMVVDLRDKNLCDGPQVHIEDDPRVTRTGRILRKLHLDELPQLWNVLTGDMSLVGPRPSPDAENRICPAWRELRLSVRPGITGLWQVKRTRKPGRDFQEWIRYDVEYVHRASFWLDLRICAQTAYMILSGRKSS